MSGESLWGSSIARLSTDAGNTVLVGAGWGKYQVAAADNEVLLVGDSMTARHDHYHISSAGSVSGTDLTLTITSGTSSTGQAITGSRCRVTGATSSALNTWATVLSMNGTSLVIRYDFDLTGLTPGTPTAWLQAIRGDGGYFNHVMALHRMQGINTNIIENQGVAGDDFSEMLARYSTDIAPYLPCRVALFGGFNDAVQVAAAANKPAKQAELLLAARTLIEQILATGSTIDLISPIPFVSGAAGVTADSVAVLKAFRAQNQGYANKYPQRVRFVDAWEAVEDADTGYAVAAYLFTTDKIHPVIAGAQAIADAYVTATAGTWLKGGVFASLSNDDDYSNGGLNCVVNPMFEGAGGSHSGGTWTAGDVPDSWVVTVGTNGVMNNATLTQRSQGGYDYNFDFQPTGASNVKLSQDITGNGVKGTSRRRCSVEIEVSGTVVNTQYLNAAIEIVDGGVTQHILVNRHFAATATGATWPKVGTRYRFESNEFDIPATATSVAFRVFAQVNAAGTYAFAVGCPQVW